MAGMITTNKTTLLTILDDACNVLFSPSTPKTLSEFAALKNFIELPVIEDSIEVDMGSVDVAYTKLTDGTVVAGKFSKGDPSCAFNVASIANAINEIFAKKVGATEAVAVDVDGDGTSQASLFAYSNGLQTKHGCLIIANADYTHMVAFPNAAISGSFNPTGGGDANTGYWAVSFIPQATAGEGADGASFYLG